MTPSPTNQSANRDDGAGEPEQPVPPGMPAVPRRLLFTPLQRWGLPVLLALPVLALIGLLGVSYDRTVTTGDGLTLEVDYPNRTRSGVATALTLTISNQGDAPVTGVYIALPRAYLESFDTFELRPVAHTVSSETYRVDVGDIPTGGSRVVTALLTPGRYGRNTGTVTVGSAALASPSTADFSTFNFP